MANKKPKVPSLGSTMRSAREVIMPEHLQDFDKRIAKHLKAFNETRLECKVLPETLHNLLKVGKVTKKQARARRRCCRRRLAKERVAFLNMQITLVRVYAHRADAKVFEQKL